MLNQYFGKKLDRRLSSRLRFMALMLICFTSAQALLFSNLSLRDEKPASAEAATIDIQTQNSTVYNPDLYGFNNNPKLSNRLSWKDYFSEPLVRALKFRSFRTGGTTTHVYLPGTDLFHPDGFSEPYPASMQTRYRVGLFAAHDEPGEEIGMPDVWAGVAAMGASLIHNVNIGHYYDSSMPGQVANNIRAMQAMGVGQVYIELGNELYFYRTQGIPFWKGGAWDMKLYEARVRAYWSTISKYSATFQFGVPMPVPNHGKRTEMWAKALQSSRLPYDAISMHLYHTGQTSPEGYVGSASYAYVERTFPEYISIRASEFPGKHIWITEWNIVEPKLMCQTWYGLLFAAHMWWAIHQHPEITIANYHRTYSGAHAIFNAEGPRGAKKFVRTYPYFLWREVGALLEHASHYMKNTVAGAPNVRALSWRSPSRALIMIVNLGSDAVDMNARVDGSVIHSGNVRQMNNTNVESVWHKGDPVLDLPLASSIIHLPPLSVSFISSDL